jgi:hypothetical protein
VEQKQDILGVWSSDLLSDAPFYQHLANGTLFFHNREYEQAITEWQEAARQRPDFSQITKNETDSFRGTLTHIPLLGFFYALFANGCTGVATIQSDEAYKEIFFKEGWIVSARSTKSEERLGNFLQRRDLLASFDLDAVIKQARASNLKLGEFLVKGGLLSEKELFQLLDFQAKEILSDLFLWKKGEFFFSREAIKDDDVVISYAPLDIALYIARRALDFSAFRRMIPSNKIIFRVPPYIEREKQKVVDDLDVNERFIFSLIDGNRNVEQLIAFSGDDEISVINILYRLVLMGLIKKSKDIGTYEDREFKEISRFMRTFLEVFRLVTDDLKKEVGIRTTTMVDEALQQLPLDYRKLFNNVAMNKELPPDENGILKNIAAYYPDPAERLVFIDGFHALLHNILNKMSSLLGVSMTKRVVADIGRIRWDIYRFYTDSPMKRKVLEVFDKLVAQYQ